MIKPEQIPDEVVEEAAIAAMKDGGCGLTVEGKHVLCCDSRVRGLIGAYGESLWCDVADCSCYTMARAALAAGLAAWPGMKERQVCSLVSGSVNYILLPLPKESTND